MKNRIVYSTDPEFKTTAIEPTEDLPKKKTELRLSLDRKLRAGKAVTLIEGFREPEEDLREISRALKTLCASGGTIKHTSIEIQGDHRGKVESWLKKRGYRVKRIGG
ncbi:MAG: translation initiation factor [Bacteroidetes bacterium]|nr:translation initiation factor [Bacteroidota bacterium]